VQKKYISILIILAGFISGFSISLIVGEERAVDYQTFYYPQLKAWVDGTSKLYDINLSVHNAPWLMWLLRPLILFPYSWQVAAIRGFSIAVVCYSALFTIQNFKKETKIGAFCFAVLNIFTVALFLTSQVDAFPLLGLIICLQFKGWFIKGVGYVLMVIKPPNFWIFALFLFFWEVKKRGWQSASKV
jgi:hypothetical protein